MLALRVLMGLEYVSSTWKGQVFRGLGRVGFKAEACRSFQAPEGVHVWCLEHWLVGP